MDDRESKLEQRLVKRAKEKGALIYKFLSSVSGVPDRLIIHNGKVFFVELKAKGGRLSPIQRYTFKQFQKQGFEVFVIWKMAGVEFFAKKFLT